MNKDFKICWLIKLAVLVTVIVTVTETVVTGTVAVAPYLVLISGIIVMGTAVVRLINAYYGKE